MNLDSNLPQIAEEKAVQIAFANSAARPRFGSERHAALYERAKRAVIDYQVLRIYQRSVLPSGAVAITICNTWQLIRHPASPSVDVLERDFTTGAWCHMEPTVTGSEAYFQIPYIQLMPHVVADSSQESGYLWRKVLERALYTVLSSVGRKGPVKSG